MGCIVCVCVCLECIVASLRVCGSQLCTDRQFVTVRTQLKRLFVLMIITTTPSPKADLLS